MPEPGVHSLAPYKLRVQVHSCEARRWRCRQNTKGYGDSQMCSEFKVSPGYLRPCRRLVSAPFLSAGFSRSPAEVTRRLRSQNSHPARSEDTGNRTLRAPKDIRIQKDLSGPRQLLNKVAG